MPKGTAVKKPEKKDTEAAPAAPVPRLRQWITLLLVMAALATVYLNTRDIVHRRLVYGYAQGILNSFATGTVEKMGSVDLSAEGNLIIGDAVVTHLHRGKKRTFYRAERIEIALDGWPLREETVYCSRVDLFHPEMWVVREKGGDWNVLWALQPPPEDLDTKAPTPPPELIDPTVPWPHPIRGGFPRNGVHIHHGTIYVTFVRDNGTELTWRIDDVNMVMSRQKSGIRIGPVRGRFYGGELLADVTIPCYSPFRMDMQLTVRGAEAAQLAEGAPFITRKIGGRIDGVLALTAEPSRIGWHPICAGRIDVTDGDLYDLPAFVGILATLALTPVEDRKIYGAQIEYTVERDRVRIDKMYFLGRPLSLFGDGEMSVTGEWIDITMIPRIGKSMNDILPIIGAPIQLLLNIFKGALIPFRITGPFWAPVFSVGPGSGEVRPQVKKLIDEKTPP